MSENKDHRPALTGRMQVQCGHCGDMYGQKPCEPALDGEISTGVCGNCLPGVLAEIKITVRGGCHD